MMAMANTTRRRAFAAPMRRDIFAAAMLLAATALMPRPAYAAVSVGGWMAHSPDDIGGFTTLTGDNNTASVGLPFTFTVEGTGYTTVVLSTNGWIEFGSNTAGDSDPTNDCLPTSAHTNPLLAAYWDDLNPFGTSIRHGTVGSSPNRVFIADYEVDLTSGSEGSDDLRFQVQLHEGSNLITVKYRDTQNNANGQSATIGFQGAGGGSATSVQPLVCNGKILDDNRPDEGWSADVGRAGRVVLAANVQHSPDDISGFTTLTGDNATASVGLGFSVTIEGTSYSSVAISTNGWLELGGNTAGDSDPTNDCLPTAAHTNPFLAAYWDDLNPFGNSVRYGTVGSSPNRVFIADFQADVDPATENGGEDDFSFQVQIHEGSGLMNVRYRDLGFRANGQAATIGFQGAGGANSTAYPLTCNGKILDDNDSARQGWSIHPESARALALHGVLSHSPDDITGFTTLSGNDSTAAPSMPFSIVIDGTSYSTVAISTNGWLEFGGNTAADSDPSNDCLPTSAHSNPFLAAYWDDMQTQGTNVRYGTVGSSPNRTFIVDFVLDVVAQGGSDVIGIQVEVHESSHAIGVKYRTENVNANGQAATIGFQGAGGGAATAHGLVCNGKILDDNRDREGWSVAPLPVCGNSIIEISEQCDTGGANGTLASCCTSSCTYKSNGTACTDDGNVCTDDLCNGVSPVCQHPSNTGPCTDSIFCNGTDTCSGGTCSLHSGNPCPGHNLAPICNDSCDEGSDSCTGADIAGISCDDAQFCTVIDTCNGVGACVGANSPCPGEDVGPSCADSCDEATDGCTAPDDPGTSCSDGLFCTVTDTCNLSGICVGTGNPCPGHNVPPSCSDSCDEDLNNCTGSDNVITACNDGLFCTQSDFCNGSGSCAGSGNPCPGHDTGPSCNDSCDEGADNCAGPDAGGTGCSDGLFCTQTDSCDGGGTCDGGGNPCPGHDVGPGCNDSCDEGGDNCTAPDSGGTGCDDGLFCTQTDTCNGSGTCAGAGNPCPGDDAGPSCNDSCDEGGDDCTAPDSGGTACDDTLFCTQTDTCDGSGACNGSGDPCSGGPECADSCNEGADNCFDPVSTPCTDDGQFCNGAEVCNGAGTCAGAGDPCTGGSQCADTCNEVTDDCFDLTGTPCTDDGSFCNGIEACNGSGGCVGAGDPCTGGSECADSCNETADDCFDLVSAPCTDDGLFCSGAEACDGAGACAGSGDPCSSGPECADSCNETADNCFDPVSTPCTDDGLFCNGTEICDGAGTCAGGGDPCSGGPECADNCNEGADNCFETSGTACAADGNVCTDDVCDGAGACGVDNMVTCDDGSACTAMDQCGGGSCGGMTVPGCGDHYVGYKIKAPKSDALGADIPGNVFPRGWVVTINDVHLSDVDADDPENFVVKKEKTLLVEAVKNTEPGPNAPGLRYLRYQMNPGPETVGPAEPDGDFPKPPKHVLREWQLDNQFGTINVLSKKVKALLVPASAHPTTAPAAPGDTTHYTCYQVKPSADVTDQTPDKGDGTGKFRKGMQAFFEEELFGDCALLADGATPSFDGSTVEGKCLFDLGKPIELCNPADKTEVVLPRETIATIDESTAQTQLSLLCYKIKLSTKITSTDVASLSGLAVGSKLDPKQAKHVKRGVKTNDPVRIAAGNQFPAPAQVNTKGQAMACVPTDVLGVAAAP
jgi:hypothetical protein